MKKIWTKIFLKTSNREKRIVLIKHKKPRISLLGLKLVLFFSIMLIVLWPMLNIRPFILLDKYVYNIKWLKEDHLQKIYNNYNNKIDTTIIDEKSNQALTDKLDPYSVEMFSKADVLFPEIHFIMFFKESSFCKPIEPGHTPTLCTNDIIDIIGFNPNNGSGMKHPYYRPTLSIGPIGDVIKQRKIKLDSKYKRYYNDPHAVFKSPYDHCKDIALWQKYWFKRKGYTPNTALDYIAFLKKVGYNPYDHYYNHPKKGLKALYSDYQAEDFQKKYDKYLVRI
jgi:hypothetical protein